MVSQKALVMTSITLTTLIVLLPPYRSIDWRLLHCCRNSLPTTSILIFCFLTFKPIWHFLCFFNCLPPLPRLKRWKECFHLGKVPKARADGLSITVDLTSNSLFSHSVNRSICLSSLKKACGPFGKHLYEKRGKRLIIAKSTRNCDMSTSYGIIGSDMHVWWKFVLCHLCTLPHNHKPCLSIWPCQAWQFHSILGYPIIFGLDSQFNCLLQ